MINNDYEIEVVMAGYEGSNPLTLLTQLQAVVEDLTLNEMMSLANDLIMENAE